MADLNAVATKEGWDKVVPVALQKFSKYNGKWIAAPVNVHSHQLDLGQQGDPRRRPA